MCIRDSSRTLESLEGPGTGSWVQDEKGWWYKNADSTYPVDSWMQIGGKWYFFGGDGYMQTGWINWNDKWYFCDLTTGAMLVNQAAPDGQMVGNDGARVEN